MTKNNTVNSYGTIQYIRYTHAVNAERIRKGPGLYDDVENFVRRHDTGISDLVEKLINNNFGHRHYSDHEYLF